MQYVTVYQNVNFLSANKKFKNDNTIQLNPQLIMTIQALVSINLLTYYVCTIILFLFCAKFSSVEIAQNGLTVPL